MTDSDSSRGQAQQCHPRKLGWVSTSALAMGGSNQSIFLIGALVAGQGSIPGQGSAAIPLLILGLALGWAALPGWTELILMWPNRVGGIAATCGEAFRPYAPVLGNLAGVSYWWGWVPTCGLTALLSASAISQWFLPHVSVPLLACGIVALFAGVNFLGVVWAGRLAVVIATVSALLAFLSAIIPILAGTVDWQRAVSFHLNLPFPGAFGAITSAMAGLYLVGFAAPAFEAAACHVGETIHPAKNVPRAMYASAGMSTLYFLVLPVVWLGAIGPKGLTGDLALTLGPTFAPWLGALGKSAATWFMMFNMFHGTLAPLTGVARTLSQLAEDGLLPESFTPRNRQDCPWVAISLTSLCAIVFLLIGDPIWLIAAANFTYLIGIALPSVAVWLLRRDQPRMARPYRAPRGTITLGLCAAIIWGVSTILGFQQFGLPTVILGVTMAYSGAALYGWRKWRDHRKTGRPGVWQSLHVKLTGAMLVVLTLDGAGYYLAVHSVTVVAGHQSALIAGLEDIFVAVAILTITVGLVLPGMIAHSVGQVAQAADRLATGTLADFSRAMDALAIGDLEGASARIDCLPVTATSRDEVGEMARSFNVLQAQVAHAALGLAGAREGLRASRAALTEISARDLSSAQADLAKSRELARVLELARDAAIRSDRLKSDFVANMSHELRTPMNGVIGMADLLLGTPLTTEQQEYTETIQSCGDSLLHLITDVLDFAKIEAGELLVDEILFDLKEPVNGAVRMLAQKASAKGILLGCSIAADVNSTVSGDPSRLKQVLANLVGNAVKFTNSGVVAVRVTKEPKPSDRLVLRFEVQDTGIGIPVQEQQGLFQRFVQADSSTTRKYGGTGLGLAISKHLVEIMGGSIGFTSEPGKGSTFWFTASFGVSLTATATQGIKPLGARLNQDFEPRIAEPVSI